MDDCALMANPRFVTATEKLIHALETTEIDWDKVKKVDFNEWLEEAYRRRHG